MIAPMANRPLDEAPYVVEILPEHVGAIIGTNGSTIKKLIQATGCNIEVPRREAQNDGMIEVQLSGSSEQRERAIKAIRDVAAGGDPDDSVGTAEGALILAHSLDSYDKEFWLAWRLVPVEVAHKVRAAVSRHNVRLLAETRHGLSTAVAQLVRNEAEAAIAEARELVEIVVNASLDYDTDYAKHDAAVSPLVDKYGVLLHVPRPEDGCVPIRIVGPSGAAADAAALLEARYIKGKSTASLLQQPAQVQAMEEQMAIDFDRDLRSLEEESRVKIHRSHALLWIVGAGVDSVSFARNTLQEMMQFYFPEKCVLLDRFNKAAIEKLREDPELRVLSAKPDCAIAFHAREGTLWVCGEQNSSVKKRLDAFMAKWSAEHWEYDLADYATAMWLLGPRGTGEYLGRLQNESGATLKVCPNNRKVWAEGTPAQVKRAERLVLEALEKLKKKKETEGEFGASKPKALLSDVPEHMRVVLEKLAELDEKKRIDDMKQRILERERQWNMEAEANGAPAVEQGNRERSRSRSGTR